MSGLCTRRLVWCAAGRRYRLDPEPLEVDRGQVATVLAPPEVGRALADVVAGLARRGGPACCLDAALHRRPGPPATPAVARSRTRPTRPTRRRG